MDLNLESFKNILTRKLQIVTVSVEWSQPWQLLAVVS